MKQLNLIGLLAIACAFAAGVSAAPKVDIGHALEQWLDKSPAGIAAAWIDADGVQFANVGNLAREEERAITADTQFEIGSITKVFTALLLADAVRANKVTLDAPIGAPFPSSSVTFLQLATHTSGLPRMPADFVSSDPLNPYAEVTLPVLIQSFAAATVGLKPAPAAYSNFGFAVLGHALAAVWGQPYEKVLTERVLQPLGMNDTRLSWRLVDASRLAAPNATVGAAKNWDLNGFAPAGGLVSTSRDLARFVQANLDLVETPLHDTLAFARKVYAPGNMPAHQLGLAWQIEQRGQSTLLWHNGATGGYQSFLAIDVTARTGVVLLSNQQRGLAELGFEILAGKMPAAPKPKAPAAEKLKEYLGNDPLAPSFVIAITAEGEALFLQATNQPRLKLQALAGDRYRVEGVPAEISFEREGEGKIAALILHQNGMNQRAPRMAPDLLPVAPKEIELPIEELEAYIGRYQLGGAQFTITRIDTRLLVQLTGQPPVQVYASARDEFFYKVVNAQLSFQRAANGGVDAVVLHQNGLDQRAPKVRNEGGSPSTAAGHFRQPSGPVSYRKK